MQQPRPRTLGKTAASLGFAFASCAALANATDGEPPWPKEWFEPPLKASQVGLTRFAQSPYLDDRDLPPVEERLPDDPIIIEPYRNIGKYGGTARITLWDTWQFFNWEHALTLSANMRDVLPNLAESWELSEDGRVTTIHLRPGIKWSDGHPLTADDFMFRLKHVWQDPDISPVVYRLVQGCEFVKIDDYTFQYVFPEPNPMFANFFAQYGSHFVDPMHFFKNYHGAFRDKANSTPWSRRRASSPGWRCTGRCAAGATRTP